MTRQLTGLNNQHGIAVAEETILFLNGFLVRFFNQLVATERTGNHNQDRFRQVQVR